jgi:para-aminobenzoate synthetase component 1
MTLTPHLEELPYAQDSAACFGRLAELPWCVFLDSGRHRSDRGRFDILSAEPRIRLTTRGDRTLIQEGDDVRDSTEDPFALVRTALGARKPCPAQIPFAGGAIGYFAYDLARRIERLPSICGIDIDMPDMAVGIYDWAVVVDHQERRCWLVDYAGDSEQIERRRQLAVSSDTVTPAAYSSGFVVTSAVRPDVTRERYAEAFKRIKRYIREGDCYQVNLTQRFSASAEGHTWSAYRQLRDLNPAPFSAYFAIDDGAVLSSSPERFLRVKADGAVETQPIKGTRPRGDDPMVDLSFVESLRASEKDQAENLMIVDLLRNDIGKSCAVGSVGVPKLFEVQSFATVHHLVSTIHGRLDADRDALDLLRGCFPGGSITGAPKVRAMEIIEELEASRRCVYCGSIGYIGFDGAMDSNIAIRTLVSSGGHLYCWAGGGIVYDSDLDAEYQESLDKAAAMLRLFLDTESQDVGRKMWR